MADTKISAGADPVTLVATDKVPMARSASTTAYAATMTELAAFANTAYTPNYFAGTPSMDGTGAPGTAAFVSRGDHVHPSDTTRATVVGVTDGSNAAAGQVGEFISSNVAAGSAVALTNGTPANVTSISLTAGDWDVWGSVCYTAAGATMQSASASLSTASASVPSAPNGGGMVFMAVAWSSGPTLAAGMMRVSTATPQTIYLVAYSNFSSTNGAYGFIGARRAR